jgi:hypothetical protein
MGRSLRKQMFLEKYFLIEFLSILSGRLSYLTDELLQFLRTGEGDGGMSRCVGASLL